MKRSHAIMLGATGILLAGAWVGRGHQRVDSGSNDPGTDVNIHASLEECLKANTSLLNMPKIVDGKLVEEKTQGQLNCEQDFKEATEKHVSTAPKFADANACEAQYGPNNCRPATFNGASVFVPAMIGMMAANHIFGGNRNAQALMPPLRSGQPCAAGHTPETQPGCTAPPRSSSSSSSSSGGSGSWRSYSTASGHTVSKNTDNPKASSKIPTAAAAAPAARSSLGAVSARSSGFATSSFSSSSASRGGFGSTGSSISRSSSS